MRPGAVVAAGTMDENQALFVRSKIAAINPTGDFRRFNIKIFQHIKLLPWQISITKAKKYAMKEKNAENLLINRNKHSFLKYTKHRPLQKC